MPLSQSTAGLRSFDAAMAEYEKIGQMLYGIHEGEDSKSPPAGSREDRRIWRERRRLIEGLHPDVRQAEDDTYRVGARNRVAYIPRIYINYSGIEGTGTVSFPSGSRTQLTERRFFDKEGLRGILALLAYDGQIHPDATEVVTSGSALLLTTYLASLV